MAWYRAGTVSVTNGSATVTGAGTDFVANASVGEAFLGPDGRTYEITQVISATQIVLGMPYQGAGAGGQGYAVLPTQSFARDLALGAAELLNTFAAVRDGAGKGLFSDGTVAAPGVRFASDQDTGIYRSGPNTFGMVTGGVLRMWYDGTYGYMPTPISNSASNGASLTLRRSDAGAANLMLTSNFPGGTEVSLNSGVNGVSNDGFSLALNGTNRMIIDGAGNMLVGITTGAAHTLAKPVPQGTRILDVLAQTGQGSAQFCAVAGSYNNGAACALDVGANTTTNRSINGKGTGNFSGSDYAEYMPKAAGCGTIAKGDVCGIDREGRLTKTWADAISFVIKSTDPSLVGGDTWDAEVGPRPEQPGAAPTEPSTPVPPAEDADAATIAAWRDAMAAYPAQVSTYQAARAEWQKATDAYAKALPVWEAAHEKARQCVDRIAFCGQVPANVSGDFEVGDYIIAAASGAGIKAVAVKADDMTLPQYMRRIGKVWAVRDGRAWIDVQHG